MRKNGRLECCGPGRSRQTQDGDRRHRLARHRLGRPPPSPAQPGYLNFDTGVSSGAAGVRPARTAGGRSADRRSWEVGRSGGGRGGAGRAQAGLLGAQDVATWSHFLFPPLPRPWPCLVLAAVPGTGRVTDCSSGNITSYHATAAGHREDIRQREAPHCSCGPAFPILYPAPCPGSG